MSLMERVCNAFLGWAKFATSSYLNGGLLTAEDSIYLAKKLLTCYYVNRLSNNWNFRRSGDRYLKTTKSQTSPSEGFAKIAN